MPAANSALARGAKSASLPATVRRHWLPVTAHVSAPLSFPISPTHRLTSVRDVLSRPSAKRQTVRSSTRASVQLVRYSCGVDWAWAGCTNIEPVIRRLQTQRERFSWSLLPTCLSPFLKAFGHRYLPGRYTSRLNFLQFRPTRYGVNFKFYQAYCKPRQNMLQMLLTRITLISCVYFQN